MAFVGVDGSVVRYNTIYRPEKWVVRILQENTADEMTISRLPAKRSSVPSARWISSPAAAW